MRAATLPARVKKTAFFGQNLLKWLERKGIMGYNKLA